jgi:hypothetical protein
MMNFMHWNQRVRWIHCAAGLVLISSLAGCNRDEARVYHVAKDDSSPAQPAPAAAPDTTTPMAATPDMSAPPPDAMAVPQLKYQLPAGWQEKPPSEMRVASFTALGANGQSADISAIPLPIVGRDLELVNMWRSQVQLPATSDPDAVNRAEPVAIGVEQGRLFEFVSEQPMAGKSRQRIMVATLTRGAMSWFFKMAGDDAFVTSQKKKFLQLLKSVSFAENAPAPIQTAPTTQAENNPSIWAVPSDWQPLPPSQFLLAEFSIPGVNGAKAEVNVAEMDGEGGGLLANVNRWRGQLGLGAIGEADLSQLAQSLDVTDGKATLVDLAGVDAKTGAPTQLVGVIVAQNGQTWFYKLMGDKPIVAREKDAFTKFIQSANYANAR